MKILLMRLVAHSFQLLNYKLCPMNVMIAHLLCHWPKVSIFLQLQELATSPSNTKLKTLSPKNKTGRPGVKLSAVTSRKNPISLKPQNGQLPPTNDPGPWQLREEKSSLIREIIRLQNELEVYVQKVEALANRGKTHHLTLGFYLTENKVQLPLFL